MLIILLSNLLELMSLKMATYLNNPLNIRSGQHWLGLVGEKNGFCLFRHEKFSVRAALYLIFKTYPKKYAAKTIEDAIYLYAPLADGNFTTSYVSYVCRSIQVPCNYPLNKFTPRLRFQLIKAMAWMESCTVLGEMFYSENHLLFELKL